MSAAVDDGLAWFPLVPRPRPPGLPLQARVVELATLASGVERETCQERATRAAEVFNKAALIVSDCGVPALVRELCRRQYELFAQQAPLPGWAVRLALQPVLNIPRQLIRDGHGDDAHTMLQALHQAALSRASVVIDSMRIDFSALNSTLDGHKEACTLTWTALLADGTRALAQAGRWRQAAEHAAAHRGIGARLLDGRQAAILALLTDGQADEAAQMTEQSTVTEPWEHAVQAILRVLRQRAAGQDTMRGIATMIAAACALLQVHDPATTVTRTRIGLIALDLAGSEPAQAHVLRSALVAAGSADAYVARDLLASRQVGMSLTSVQRSGLQDLVRACGLGAGTIPVQFHDHLTSAVGKAEVTLTQAINASPGSLLDEDLLRGAHGGHRYRHPVPQSRTRSHHPPAAPPPALPRRQTLHEPKPPAAFRVIINGTQRRDSLPSPIADLRPDNTIPDLHRDRNRLAGTPEQLWRMLLPKPRSLARLRRPRSHLNHQCIRPFPGRLGLRNPRAGAGKCTSTQS